MRVAAIDCGTNTIKLLIGSLLPSNGLSVDVREMRMVRLGQDLDRTGRIADEALERAFAAIDEYAEMVRAHDVPADRVRFVATSATRDAANSDVFVEGVRDRLGVEPEVVSGDVEAALSFDGAVRNLRTRPATPVLVVDIGGGSTELILGATTPEASRSMDIGSVRLTERHLHSDPPTEAEIAACVADIDAHLDACPVDPAGAATIVGVAGTVTQLASVALGLPAYDRRAVDQHVLPVAEVDAVVDRLLAMTVDERRAIPSMHPGRADVIGAGTLILDRVLRRSGLDTMVVSDCDILDGIAWSMVDRRDAP
ncbi:MULTISPECIES: exopolyphosphatase [unclassified Nocardioides]|uniref:Ppx/GppA phosphatase family protein n=1 Tax=unclassified Nocardioides TaxID=2615069 RepID=UPI00361A961A